MKKFFSLLMALVVVFSLSTVAFAAEKTETISGTSDFTSDAKSSDVTIGVEAATGGSTIYHVVIKWDDLSFTYTNANAGTWDPQTHTYTGTAEAMWDKTSANFYIENHSNAGIAYSTEYVAKTGVTAPAGVNIAAEHSGSLASADDDQYRYETKSTIAGDSYKMGPNVTLTVSVSGNPTEAFTSAAVGSVKVTISAASSDT